ncbi:MAG: TonB-dependent receptor [Methylophilales bacterium]|nr:TonB-dependent receptor [Methylophilales bacterium]
MLRYFFMLGVMLLSFPALAENKAEVLETGTVEVVGTTPLPGLGTAINEVPSNVQAVSGKAIAEQRSLDISEFIDTNLGSVSSSNTVANPYQADVSFRGFTASPLLGTPQGLSVFMDGVRVNEPFGDIVNWDLIPSNAISSISLIPGSNPLFGLNTLGGALSVNTKSGAVNPGVGATLYGGSWGRKAFEFEAGGEIKDKNIDYFVAGNLFEEDGWRDHSSSFVNQLFAKVGWQDDNSDLDLSLMLANSDMEGTQALPLSMMNNRSQAYSWPDSVGNNLAMINLKGSHFLNDEMLVAADTYYRKNRITGFNSNLVGDIATPIQAHNIATETDQDGFGGALQFSLLRDVMGHKNQFTVGASADLGRTDFSSNTYDAVVVGNQTVTINPVNILASVRLKADNDYYGVYATDNFSITDKLNLTLSGRYNKAEVKLQDQIGVALNGDHNFERFNPAIGLNFNPTKSLGLYGGYNEGMRAPTPVELTCADPAAPCSLPNSFVSDPALKMVVARTWEGGARGKLAQDLNWNIGLYHTELSDDILFQSTGSATGYFSNVGKTQRQGFEMGLNGKISGFSFAANYGFVDATFQTDFVALAASNSSAGFDCNGNAAVDTICVHKGNKIPGIPQHTLKLRVGYEITPNWSVGSNVVMAAGQYARGDENNQDANGKVPGYAVIHLDTHYRINDNWQLFAKVNNVFDKDYATFGVLGDNAFSTGVFDPDSNNWTNEQFRSPAAPRAAWVGVTYEFGKPKGGSKGGDD